MKKIIRLTLLASGIIVLHSCQSNTGNISSAIASTGNAIADNISGNEGSYSFKVAGKEVNEKGTLMTGYKADVSTDDGVKVLSLVLTNASAEDGSSLLPVTEGKFDLPVYKHQ